MPKWWFFQTSFEDQTINCKQLPKAQKHTKTIGFLMILRVRCFGRWKKKMWKSNEKLKLKLDMHVWWMFDQFWIDFQRIWRSFLDANRFRRGYQRRSQRVMGVNVRCGGQKCCSGEKNAPPGRPQGVSKSSQTASAKWGPWPISPRPPLYLKVNLLKTTQSA